MQDTFARVRTRRKDWTKQPIGQARARCEGMLFQYKN